MINQLMIRKVDNDKLYTRVDASKEMGIHVTTFDKYFRDADEVNKKGIAMVGRRRFYIGSELNKELGRIVKNNPTVAIVESAEQV